MASSLSLKRPVQKKRHTFIWGLSIAYCGVTPCRHRFLVSVSAPCRDTPQQVMKITSTSLSRVEVSNSKPLSRGWRWLKTFQSLSTTAWLLMYKTWLTICAFCLIYLENKTKLIFRESIDSPEVHKSKRPASFPKSWLFKNVKIVLFPENKYYQNQW